MFPLSIYGKIECQVIEPRLHDVFGVVVCLENHPLYEQYYEVLLLLVREQL